MTGIMGLVWSVYSSKWGKILAACMAGLLALGINNAWQRSKGRKQVVIASQKAGLKRNEQTDKIRARIKPGTAMRRLRDEYADGR